MHYLEIAPQNRPERMIMNNESPLFKPGKSINAMHNALTDELGCYWWPNVNHFARHIKAEIEVAHCADVNAVFAGIIERTWTVSIPLSSVEFAIAVRKAEDDRAKAEELLIDQSANPWVYGHGCPCPGFDYETGDLCEHYCGCENPYECIHKYDACPCCGYHFDI